MFNKQITRATLALLAAGCITSTAHADLYVSPILSTPSYYSGGQEVQKLGSGIAIGNAHVKGDFSQSQQPHSQPRGENSHGQDVPLFIALQNIVPLQNGWSINLDDNLDGKLVSWSGQGDWSNVTYAIAQQNGLFASVNFDEKAVGISPTKIVADSLASRVPKVWRLDKHATLKQNLEKWARQAGWSLHWDEDLTIDYPISHDAVITGLFESEDGAISQVLSAFNNEPQPLTAEFYTSNRVVRILQSGYRKL